MIVVADTSPIHYLVLTESIDVLSSLFAEVVIPPGVLSELQHLVDLPRVVARLRQTNFHIADRVLERALRDDAERLRTSD